MMYTIVVIIRHLICQGCSVGTQKACYNKVGVRRRSFSRPVVDEIFVSTHVVFAASNLESV